MIYSSGSRIFLRGDNSQSGIILQFFCRKLHENERIRTRGGSLADSLGYVNGLFRQSLNGTGTGKNGESGQTAHYAEPSHSNLCGTGTCTYTLAGLGLESQCHPHISSVCKPGHCGRVDSASDCQTAGLQFKSGILPMLKQTCGESDRLLW